MIGDLGLLALRLVLGLVFLGHGAQKAFGAFGGPGLAGASGFMASLGFKPARFWAAAAAFGELLAGVLMLLGLLLPVGAGGPCRACSARARRRERRPPEPNLPLPERDWRRAPPVTAAGRARRADPRPTRRCGSSRGPAQRFAARGPPPPSACPPPAASRRAHTGRC